MLAIFDAPESSPTFAELRTVDAISELVDTVVTFQVYDELLDIEVAYKITQILNLLETLGNSYELYRRDYDNLQKLINLTGRMIGLIDEVSLDAGFFAARGRRMQQGTSSIESLRDLMKLILQVKRSQADQKCAQEDTTAWSTNKSHFELFVKKYGVGAASINQGNDIFVHNLTSADFLGQQMEVELITRELVTQTLLRNETTLATWFCL